MKLLMDKNAALTAQNCDDLFDLGFRSDGTYFINVVGKILLMFCEFGQGGYNWLVSKQNILLFEWAVTFFLKLAFLNENRIESNNLFYKRYSKVYIGTFIVDRLWLRGIYSSKFEFLKK